MSAQRVTTLPHIPSRPADGHKGTFGRVLIIAGSPGMSGAAALSGLGALRGGAGLVSIATPKSVVDIVATIEPSYLTVPLAVDDSGHLKSSALSQIQKTLNGKDAAAIGPGLGTSTKVKKIVTTLYEQAEQPLVVDADALNIMAGCQERLGQHAAPRILTPHPGEFARLINSDIATVQKNREELAIRFAGEHRVVLVLKGNQTIVTDGERFFINTTGNSGMATGGTGDVLTGLITALLAQKYAPFAAAQLGVYLHGLAGDIAAEEFSPPGLIASDLPCFLGAAWRRVLL